MSSLQRQMGRPSKKDTGHCQPSILFGKAVFASKEINWQAQPLSHGYETVHLAFHSSSFNHLPASTVLRCILMKSSGSSPWDHPIEGPSLLTGGESFILLYREKSSLLRHSATRIQLSAGKIASEQLYCHLRPQIYLYTTGILPEGWPTPDCSSIQSSPFQVFLSPNGSSGVWK